MTSASSSSAKHLFSDSKRLLADRVGANINNIGSVARQIVRGSKSPQMLSQTIRNVAQIESIMKNSAQNLHKVELLRQHIGYQYESIKQNTEQLDYLKEQVSTMER